VVGPFLNAFIERSFRYVYVSDGGHDPTYLRRILVPQLHVVAHVGDGAGHLVLMGLDSLEQTKNISTTNSTRPIGTCSTAHAVPDSSPFNRDPRLYNGKIEVQWWLRYRCLTAATGVAYSSDTHFAFRNPLI
jgi:hypothetical protein